MVYRRKLPNLFYRCIKWYRIKINNKLIAMRKKMPPKLKSKGDLYKKLFIHFIGGFWNVLDIESKRYFHLMMILIDKSVYEYNNFYGFVVEDIKTNDSLSYRLKIIWHLENCVNAVGRASKVLRIIRNGVDGQKKARGIAGLIEDRIVKKIDRVKILKIRNKVEHIDDDIFHNKLKGSFFVDLDETYENIIINKKSIILSDLVLLIDSFYELLIDINNHLPNRIENGRYFYDKR